MGRWSYLDSDEERLPEGMVRVGYDADTQVYTYRDSDGSYWEGAPGARYGKLHRVRSSTPPLPSVHIANDIRGEEQPYILHDFYGSDTDESSGEGDPAFSHGNNGKAGTSPRSPNKAVLHGADRPHHPTPGKGSKTLPRLFTATDRNPDPDPDPDPDLDTDTDKLSTATTIRASVSSAPSVTSEATTTTATNDASTNARTGSGLRRTGTLSRLVRFLSPSSPSPSDPGGRLGLSRRATVHGGTGGEKRKEGPSPSRSCSFSSRRPWAAATSGRSGGDAAGNARWPGSGPGPGPGAGAGWGPGGQRKKCATTFEEILGE